MSNQLLVYPFPAGKSIAQGIETVNGTIALAGSAVTTGEPINWANLVTGVGYNEANYLGNGVAHGSATALVTAFSASSGTITATANNNFVAGQSVTFAGCTSTLGAKLNGQTFTVATASSTQFTFASTATGSGASEVGLAVSGSSVLLDTPAATQQTASVTAVAASSGIVTVTAANNFLPGAQVQFTNGSGGLAASLCNGNVYTVLTASSSQFTIATALTGSTGTATAMGANPPQPVNVTFQSANNSGYVYQYNQATGCLLVLQAPGTVPNPLADLGAGAYPTNVLNDVIKFTAQFVKG